MLRVLKAFFPYILIVILLLIIKGNISAIFTSLSNANTTHKLTKQLDDAKRQNQYLSEKLNYVKSDQFIGEEATDKLGLLKGGEYFVIAPTASPAIDTTMLESDKPNWKKWLELFF